MIVGQIVLIGLCMVCIAFFAGIETGVISIRRTRLRHFVKHGVSGARILQGFVNDWDRLLGTVLVGTNLFVVIVSVLAASLATSLLGHWGTAVSTIVMSGLVLIFSEYVPKAWFRSRPLERSIRFAGVLRFSEVVLRPLAVLVVWLTRWLVPVSPRSLSKPLPQLTREDLKTLVLVGAKDGVFSNRECETLQRAIDISAKSAGEIMVPRSEVTVVNSSSTVADFYRIVKESGITRMPVYDKEKNEFVGVINVFRVFSAEDPNTDRSVLEFVKPPLFIPEDMPVDEILSQVRGSHQPICLVTNDKSEVTGLITTEDILEEIVGKL